MLKGNAKGVDCIFWLFVSMRKLAPIFTDNIADTYAIERIECTKRQVMIMGSGIIGAYFLTMVLGCFCVVVGGREMV